MRRTVVVGIGNPILGDDGVGLHVARRLKGSTGFDVREAYTGGLNLLDQIIGYDRAVLIDAVYLEDMKLGEVKVMSLSDLGSVHSTNPHDATLMEALELSRSMGEQGLPSDIVLVGIRIERVSEFSEELSPVVSRSMEEALETVRRLLDMRSVFSAPLDPSQEPISFRLVAENGNGSPTSHKNP